MADIGQIKLPDNTVYNIKDENALPLTGGQVTGPVTFGDSVSTDDLTAGNVIITGAFNAIQGIPYSMITGTPTIPSAATATPVMDGTAAVGSSTKYAKEDHVHPSDTTKANLNSPSFTGTPTAPTPAALDNSTKIATTAWVSSKISLAIPEIEEAAMKLKIYYVIPDDPSGQGGYWSGQDYATYTLGGCGIYVDSEGTTLISSTQQLITDISNGIVPVLNVIDQDGAYVLCYPNWIEDDTLVIDFIGIVNSTNREFIALKIGVDIDNSVKVIYNGHYLINSGLPTVTSSDNGKFLCVVNGAWTATTVPDANGVNF